MRMFLVRLALSIFVAATALPALAATEVKFHPIPPGPDLDDAIEFMGRELQPLDYDTLWHYRYGVFINFESRELGNTVDVYVRDWVLAGRYALNDDGVEEWWFFYFDDPTFCGTAGCPVWLARKRGRAFEDQCWMTVKDGPVVITDRITVNGFHEIDSDVDHLYWHGDECISDDDAQDEESRERRATLPPRDPLRTEGPTENGLRHDEYGKFGKGPENRRALGRYRLPPVVLIDTGWRNLDGSWTAKAHKLSVQSERDFLSNPNAQEDALEDFLRATERRISAFGLLSYLGKKISGREGEIVVSEAGIMAAVHLMGASRTADYFRELDGVHAAGRKPFTDIDRAAIETRLSEFQNVPYQRLTRPSAARPRRGAR